MHLKNKQLCIQLSLLINKKGVRPKDIFENIYVIWPMNSYNGLINHSQAIPYRIIIQVVWRDLIEMKTTSFLFWIAWTICLSQYNIYVRTACEDGNHSSQAGSKQWTALKKFGKHHVNRISGSDPWILSSWKFLGSVWRICPLQWSPYWNCGRILQSSVGPTRYFVFVLFSSHAASTLAEHF